MTRFFFHLRRHHDLIEDPDGEEFETLEAARAEAVLAARELVATTVRSGGTIDGDRIEVCDESGQCLAVVRLADVLPQPRSASAPLAAQ